MMETLKRVARSLFRVNYNSMIPRFSPIVTAWVRSFAPSLERIFLTGLYGLFGNRELLGDLLVCIPGGNQAQD